MKAITPEPTSTNSPKPPRNPWMIAEGFYRAVCKQVKPLAGKIRLVFTVTIPGNPFQYFAGKNYHNDLRTGSALRNDLFSLRGHDITTEEDQAQAIDTHALLFTAPIP